MTESIYIALSTADTICHPAVGTLYYTKDQTIKTLDPSYSTTEWSHHPHDYQGLPEWQTWDYHPCYQVKQPTATYNHGLHRAEDTHWIKNNSTKQPTKVSWQEHLAKAQEPWQKISFNKPREVIRTTMKDFSGFTSGSSFHHLHKKWQRKQAKRSYYKHGPCHKRSSYKH